MTKFAWNTRVPLSARVDLPGARQGDKINDANDSRERLTPKAGQEKTACLKSSWISFCLVQKEPRRSCVIILAWGRASSVLSEMGSRRVRGSWKTTGWFESSLNALTYGALPARWASLNLTSTRKERFARKPVGRLVFFFFHPRPTDPAPT